MNYSAISTKANNWGKTESLVQRLLTEKLQML
jgi:hypothetical protein